MEAANPPLGKQVDVSFWTRSLVWVYGVAEDSDRILIGSVVECPI